MAAVSVYWISVQQELRAPIAGDREDLEADSDEALAGRILWLACGNFSEWDGTADSPSGGRPPRRRKHFSHRQPLHQGGRNRAASCSATCQGPKVSARCQRLPDQLVGHRQRPPAPPDCGDTSIIQLLLDRTNRGDALGPQFQH